MIYGVIHVLKLQFFNSCKKFFVLSNWGCKFLFERRKSLRKSCPPFSIISKFIVSDLSISQKNFIFENCSFVPNPTYLQRAKKHCSQFWGEARLFEINGRAPHCILSTQKMGNKLRAQHIGRWVGVQFFSLSMIHGAHLEFSSRAHKEREKERRERLQLSFGHVQFLCMMLLTPGPFPPEAWRGVNKRKWQCAT